MSKTLPAVLALAMASAGCFVAGEGDLTASWTITVNGAASTCAAVGAREVELHATRQKDKLEYTQAVACDLGAVTFAGFKPGLYTVEVRLLDDSGAVLSDPASLDVRVGAGDLIDLGHFEFAFDSGRFQASWVITANGAAATCADVGASVLQIVSESGGQKYIDNFECAAGSATTEPLPAGSWVVSVALLDATGFTLNQVPINQTLALTGGETKSLGSFEFAFSIPVHRASFSVQMGSPQLANCSTMAGGAGVLLQEIRLFRKSTSQCLLADVNGVRYQGSDQTTAATCTPFQCQDRSRVLTLSGLRDGDYSVQVLGYKATDNSGGKAICYVSGPVPLKVAGGDVNLGPILAPADDTLNPGRCL